MIYINYDFSYNKIKNKNISLLNSDLTLIKNYDLTNNLKNIFNSLDNLQISYKIMIFESLENIYNILINDNNFLIAYNKNRNDYIIINFINNTIDIISYYKRYFNKYNFSEYIDIINKFVYIKAL